MEMKRVSPDRLRVLLDAVLEAFDEGLDGRSLAGRAYLSRFHFDRLVGAGLGEAPAALRRRLLLERAAWQLTQAVSVTDAGFQAGYGSTEAFSRAFRRAYARPPSRFARDGGDFRLWAPNGIHFHPPAGLLLQGDKGITFSAHRRQVLIGALEELGVEEITSGCPIEWERMRAAERPHPPAVVRGTAG